MRPIERILIYRLGSLGDTVAALPCFHLIQRAFPDSQRIALTNIPVSSKAAPLQAILQEGGFIHGAIPYPVGLRNPVGLKRLAAELRRQRADGLVYLAAGRGLTAVRRDVAYFRLCGLRRIIGAPLTEELHDNKVDRRGELERESHRLARTVTALGTIDFDDRSWWDLRLTPSERAAGAAALAGLGGSPFVAVNTGGKAAEKDWGEANWRTLLSALGKRFSGRGLVFVGAREDGERARRLGEVWHAGPVLALCGQLGPRESAAALGHAGVFIGHDSGPLHLADAMNTPSVGLFGSYNRPKRWHPDGPRTRVIHRMDGLSAIRPEEVTETAAQLVE